MQTIERDDFVARRYVTQDGIQFWACEWRYQKGMEPKHQVFRLPAYPKQIRKLTPQQMEMLREELKVWHKNGFIARIPKWDLHQTITLIAECQEHKSTKVRPVLDCKPLNKLIRSSPNEDEHVTCANTIRRWRVKSNQIAKDFWCLLDIKKAYLQVWIEPFCARQVGLVLDGTYWCLYRLPFGISIAPKLLRAILRYILQENSLDDSGIDFFVDDLKVPNELLSNVKKILETNGFPTKAPEPAEQARVLGLQRVGKNRWKRREAISGLSGNTYKDLWSFTAKVCSHYPIMKWPASSSTSFGKVWLFVFPSCKR